MRPRRCPAPGPRAAERVELCLFIGVGDAGWDDDGAPWAPHSSGAAADAAERGDGPLLLLGSPAIAVAEAPVAKIDALVDLLVEAASEGHRVHKPSTEPTASARRLPSSCVGSWRAARSRKG